MSDSVSAIINRSAAVLLPRNICLTRQNEQILYFISRNGQITEADIIKLSDVKKKRAYTLAKQMCDDNLIVAVVRGADKNYLPERCANKFSIIK